MASKEALKKFKLLYEKKYKENPSLDLLGFDMCYIAIKQDLERLEKLEKVIEILKKICLFEFEEGTINQRNEWDDCYYISITQGIDELEKKEYELLKKVLEND